MYKVVETADELKKALQVRYKVFTIGQGIDKKLDVDGKDNEALNLIAINNDKVVGTVRFLINGEESILQRLAVLPDYRHQNYASGLINYGKNLLIEKGIKEVIAHAQVRSLGVYLNNGFKTYGEEFLEVGTPHISIKLDL